MGKIVKKRNEIDEKYKWDLSRMYENKEMWGNDYDKLKEEVSKFEKYEGHILDSAASLKETLDVYYELESKLEKVYVYASCSFSTDIGDKIGQELSSKAKDLFSYFTSKTAFMIPEILESPYEKIKEYEKEVKDLEKYDIILKRLFKEKKHALSKENEQLFSELYSSIANFEQSSSYIRDKIMKFGKIKDEEGKEVELTSTNYALFMKSKDRSVRKEAYEKTKNVYEEFNDSLACNYIGHIRYTELEAKMRNYKNVLEADLESINLPKSVFESLKEATHEYLNVYKKEFEMTKAILNVDVLEPYDLSAPHFDEETDYSFEEAKDIILDMTEIYGKEYQEFATSIFENRWVDVFSNQNKKNTWYQGGSYLTYPVIFANFFSKYVDVSALAHELGHAVHTIYSMKNNPYFLYEEPLFLSEVASLTNEMLLAKHLLKKITNKKQKLEILNTMISTFSSNYFDGVKGAEFEYKAHQLVEENRPINAEVLNQIWTDLSLYYTSNIVSNPNPYTWSKIPHFFTDFYYYKYATGAAIAMYLSDKILNGTELDKEKFINFLKLGNRLDPVDALKVAGVDITDKNVYKEAILSYEKLLDDYINIYNSL